MTQPTRRGRRQAPDPPVARKKAAKELQPGYQRWQERCQEAPERATPFVNTSSEAVERLYTPLDLSGFDYGQDLGFPGEYPFTRGIHATGYRARLWTMRLFAGFGSAEETNERFRYLLAQGQTGLSVAFDLPTLYGYDTDDPEAGGEYGTCGVAVSSLADMEMLFEGIPLDEVSVSMTINGPAAVVWAMYLVTAQKRGIPFDRLEGTIQNDILKEYIAQKEFLFPPEPSMRLVGDTIEFGTRHVPRWNPISISGYHIREAGATALQELAFTLADGLECVRTCVARGLDVDGFAPRLSFFFNAHNDLFEEVAKFRAARRIWAHEIRERFGAQNPRSWWLRFHTQTAGCSLTEQQPENNVIRTTVQALAAVLGGTQSLHTNSLDEAMALPSEKAARVALRTQQILAHESGAANTVDPLGGSYFVETLTDRMEQGTYDYFRRIEALGGVVPAIRSGFFQREIAEAAYRYQREIDTGQRIIVGVNDFTQGNDEPLAYPLNRLAPDSEARHVSRLQRVRRERDKLDVSKKLNALRVAAEGNANLMPYLLDAVGAYATLGETCGVLRQVFGEYREPAFV